MPDINEPSAGNYTCANTVTDILTTVGYDRTLVEHGSEVDNALNKLGTDLSGANPVDNDIPDQVYSDATEVQAVNGR